MTAALMNREIAFFKVSITATNWSLSIDGIISLIILEWVFYDGRYLEDMLLTKICEDFSCSVVFISVSDINFFVLLAFSFDLSVFMQSCPTNISKNLKSL